MKTNKNLLKYIGLAIIAIFVVGILSAHNSSPKDATKQINENQSTVADQTQKNEPKETNEAQDVAINQIQKDEPKQSNDSQSQIQNNQVSADCKIINYLPDPNCTPGEIDPHVTQENINSTICVSGYTTTVRPSTSITNKIKTERMQVYGDTDSPSNYELDHFIPLELGGSPASVLNLFPEPYANPYGAREKDKVENYLHKQVCNGAITLQVAQQEIRTNWVEVHNNCCKSTNTSNQTTPVIQTTGKYYTSSYATSKYYYPESCSAWKSLSQSYLRAFDSLEVLLTTYPSRTLSPQCE